MGKGSRARKSRESKPVARARLQAARFDHIARGCGIVMLLMWAAMLFIQILTQSTMHRNLANGLYDNESPEQIDQLVTTLPWGIISTVLMTIGFVVLFVLVYMKKPRAALIGLGAVAIGAIFFVFFFLSIMELFPAYERLGADQTLGMSFTKMFRNYYSAGFPLLMAIPTLVFAFRAAKKRDVADTMEAAESAPTLSLDASDDE